MAGTPSATSATSSAKRRSGPLKFYAVKAGRVPGVYQNWEDVRQQTEGFNNHEVQSFSTYTDAEAFVKGTLVKRPKPPKPKFYGVAVGRAPGVYTDWPTVESHTKGFKGAKHQGFATREEAQAFVDRARKGSSAPISLQGHLSTASSVAVGKMEPSAEHAPKRQKREHAPPATTLTNGDHKTEPGMGPLPPGAVDGFDPTIKLDEAAGNIRAKTADELSATKQHPTGNFKGPLVVHTDGGSRGNGKVGARAGVGVYFGPRDPRNVGEPLRGERQTNQRAELVAIARALDHVPIDRDVEIRTDSYYSIRCLREWFQNWETKGWRNAAGKSVENKELIQPILARIRERLTCKGKTTFVWVKGHSTDIGNIAADALANEGMDKWTPELTSGTPFDMSETLRTKYTLPSLTKPKQEDDDEFGEDPFKDYFDGLEAERMANELVEDADSRASTH
ncbi:hypothetical protein GGP41_008959 [Bipolaris sorokiniana]|uniref:ribonuclease H n=2 Tax=Cochliobolus sativus TaxID=45130 RepID=A0A8H6DTX6_COCSA|nr:uncharacterized protein COCSADRAFT_164090 [Bipolaris sorokiniana ND90Pr]EMD59916.1 hypothetical protein COCSADRAFT_164090 [Bipolaris sorokiniana ND90Pr]KAF5847698.1 hypothetical protein GGP41_008959 [Bipolaris sorokiniana]